MGFLFLTNRAGDFASAQDNAGSGSTASGYSNRNVISGPRSTCWRSTASSGQSGLGYQFPSDFDPTWMVIARADWMLTQNTMRVKGRKRDSGGSWTDISGFDYNPLTAADLTGPRSQDLVKAITVGSSHRGVGFLANPVSGTEAVQISKLYACIDFSFTDSAPSLGLAWQDLPPRTYSTPMWGNRPYEIERRFDITFNGVGPTTLNNFRNLTQLLYWPLFLYDEDQAVWEWKLEHVIIERYEVIIAEQDTFRVTISFARLRHYE